MSLYNRGLKKINIESYKPDIFDNFADNIVEDIKSASKEDIDDEYSLNLKKELEEKFAKLEELERQAYERGYEAGEKAGFDMGIKKAEVVINQIENLLEELINLKERYIHESKKKILALSIAIAKKIIEKEIDENQEIMFNILNNAIKKIQRQEKLIITINPSMQAIIEGFRKDIREICPKVVIEIDPNVSKNFVKVESETEEIVIDFENELYEIAKKLEELI